ncbi:MAG TPA: serpin family protein [Candidatus Angelobacter sp.]|nr:serpin family protein [Candidatus Angelobacter sp.]
MPATAVNSFGLNLLADLAARQKHKNVFLSPLSVFMALAMTESGAAGRTQAAMRQALAVPADLSEDNLHASASALLQSLRAQKGVDLFIANALWSDPRLPLSPAFVERCRKLYEADATTLNLANPAAADTINGWVKQKTQGMIPAIVSQAALAGSLAVLTNAVYFRGRWEYQFGKNETQEGDFHLANGRENRLKKVHFMHRESIPGAYRSGDGYEGAALPYESSEMRLYAILPAPGKSPEEVLAKMSLDKIDAPAEPVDLELRLPRFTLDYSVSLSDSLKRMGMALAFQGGDFTPMGSPKFFISDVLHKTRLEVDEEGTRAAAATSVIMAATSAMPRKREKKTLVFDRPFALLLRDIQTGAVLFAGVIYDPQ